MKKKSSGVVVCAISLGLVGLFAPAAQAEAWRCQTDPEGQICVHYDAGAGAYVGKYVNTTGSAKTARLYVWRFSSVGLAPSNDHTGYVSVGSGATLSLSAGQIVAYCGNAYGQAEVEFKTTGIIRWSPTSCG